MTRNQQPSRKLSRRRFLQASALGAAAAFVQVGFDLSPAQAAAMAARRQSGTLRVAWNTPATLDPITASADSEISFLNAVYDYLVDTDASSQLVPRLAESWEVSEDGLQYTITLREGVTFHDGSPLTVEDVVWTFERLKGDGPTADLFAATTVEAGEGNTVVFTLEATNPDFMYNLTDNHAVILKAEAESIGEEFNGTGPFSLQEYLVGDRAIFEANPDYWGGAPSIQTLEMIFFDDPEAIISALQGGVVDVALRMDNLTFFGLASEEIYAALDIPTSGHNVLRLRSDREPGNDERVQQAFKLATDRQAIWERVELGYGAIGNDSPIGPIYSAFHNPEAQPPARDPAAAAALLAEAGYEDGLDITFYVPNGGNRPELAQAFAAQWEEAGIRASIEIQDEATYYAEDGWLEVDLGLTPWGARPVPQLYLELYLKTGAVWNESHYSNPRMDELIDIAGTTLDEDERRAAYYEIQEILAEAGPLIIPYYFAQFMVTGQNVTGINLHPFAGRTNFWQAGLG